MTLEFEKATKADLAGLDLPEGYSLEWQKENESIRSLDLCKDGHPILRTAQDSYTFRVMVPAKPKMVTHYFVTGEIAGVKVEEEFDNMYDAQSRQDTLQDKGAEVETEKREVPDLETV